MRPAEFEEKEYEGPLYNQLERGNSHLWSPGQVLEEYLGFDRAMLLDHPYLWDLHRRGRPLRGFSPYWFPWPSFPARRQHRDRLPRFRLNCFIQAKRCEVGKRLQKRLRALGSRRPFFRFSIASDQQRTLEAAARTLRGTALFVYAAPAFSQSRQLFAHMTAGTIVQHSTFPEVLSLAGHRAWYYNEPGAQGVANADFEPIRLPGLNEQIAAILEQQPEQTESELSPSRALAELRSIIEKIVIEAEGVAESPRAGYLSEEWRSIARFAESTDAPPALISFLAVDAFASYFNLAWLTIR